VNTIVVWVLYIAMGTGNATVIDNIATEQDCKTLAIHLLTNTKIASGRETFVCESVKKVK
jgi:hypothetical protein